METVFKAEGITKRFGSLYALKDFSFEMRKGEIVGLVGPNGAGKTTFLSIATGLIKPDRGKILFKNKDITDRKVFERAREGIVKTSQIPSPFYKLTVFENVYISAFFGGGKARKEAEKEAEKSLEIVDLMEVKDSFPESLTLFQKRKLELARAIATSPEIIFLDENMTGLTSLDMAKSLEIIKRINDKGIGIVVVEHILEFVVKICRRMVVLNYGEKVFDGDVREFQKREDIKALL